MSLLSVEILTQVAGEGGWERVRPVRTDLLDYLVLRLPHEILEILSRVLHQPEEVGGEVSSSQEVPGIYV